jgi:hypothetical protein
MSKQADVADLYQDRRGADLVQLLDDAETTPPLIISAADVKMTAVRWLWKGRIALGMLNMFDGNPGLGKSTITADIAARETRGEAMPLETTAAPAGDVLVISFEDHYSCVLCPRLVAARADMKRVSLWNLDHHPFVLPDSISALESVITEKKIRLVVIDPMMAALSPSVDSYKDQDIRVVLGALAKLAERTGCAILFVRHLVKTHGNKAVMAGGGSIGIIGAMRVGLLLAKTPDAPPNDPHRLLATVKCNVGKEAPAVSLRIESAQPIVTDTGEKIEVGRVVWSGVVTEVSADDLVTDADEAGAAKEATSVIAEILAHGSVKAKDAIKQLDALGVAERTWRRAKTKLGIISARIGGPTSEWAWWTPEQWKEHEEIERDIRGSAPHGH